MKILSISTILILALASTDLSAQHNPQVRPPSISPDGTQLSFSYLGDVWTVPSEGGIARRLTNHHSYESNPQWSPDGNQIVFQGNRWGNNDIYVMDANGGKPLRLTYHSTSDIDPQWGTNNNIYFTTTRAFVQVEREDEIHQVSSAGGTPQRFLNAVAHHCAPSADGNLLVFERGNCRITREAYKGPANRDIWIYNNASKEYHQISDFEGQDIYPDWGGDQLYYLSAQNGRYNIVRQSISTDGTPTSTSEALTSFTDEGITYFDVSADGSKIVFERAASIFVMDAASGAIAAPIEIQTTADDRNDAVEHKIFAKSAAEFALSPDEKQIAFVVRGELFVKPNNKDKKRAVQLSGHPYTDKEVIWVNDSTLIFTSDRGGNFDLYALHSNDKETDLYKSFKLNVRQLTDTPEEDEDLTISPDAKKIAFRRGRGKLIMANISPFGTISNERILLDGWDTPRGIAWSPDSKWIAYSLSDLNFNREIYVRPIGGNGQPVNVSLHPRSDNSPTWSADGSKLAFLSNRNNGDSDVWFVWLRKEDWEKTKRDWEDEEEPDDEKKDKDKKDKNSNPIVIDFEDIHERIVQVTRLAGNEGDLVVSKDGEIFYFTTNGGGRQGSPGPSDLMSVKWDGFEMESLVKKINLSQSIIDEDGENIYGIKSGGSIVKIDLAKKEDEVQPFEAKMDIHHADERKQVFEEGWRRLRDGFYDPEFHGRDFAALKNQYYNRCLNASTEQDFRAYFNEMLGQLDASHMGMRGSDPDETQEDATGLLGIEIQPVPTGASITKIIPNTPADRTESKLNTGDIITAINGHSIDEGTNFYAHLNGRASERTLLSVTAPSGAMREVVIRPTSSIRTELYESWVKERKQLTEKYSNGRLGYIHIRGMNWTSFERFKRE